MSTKIMAFAAMIFVFCARSPAPVATSSDDSPVDVLSDPVQEMVQFPDTIRTQVKGIDFSIALAASYTIAGVVLGRKNYSAGWAGAMAPCDVALAWGELVKGDTYKQLKWSQSSRWYHWRHGSGFARDNAFVARYSSNNHIVPATENVKNAVLNLRRGDVVEISGYLVQINGNKDGTPYWWSSSLRRDDTGANSCEVIYVTRIRIKGSVFE